MKSEPKTALVVGATGVVGRALVRRLCEMRPDYGRVLVWARRPLTYRHPKLFVETIDFDRLEDMPPERVSDIYCALGTTLKQAGSKEAFLKVDVQYPEALALWGRRAGARCFVLVSSPGADAASAYLYLRDKGEAEDAARAAGYESLISVHPPLIDGQRTDFRLGEILGISFFNLFGRLLPEKYEKYKPMSGGQIAAAILAATENPEPGEKIVHPYENILPQRADDVLENNGENMP